MSDANNIAGPHLLLDAAFQSATSSAFVVPTTTQSLHFKYITWNNAGSAVPSNVHVDVLNGNTFAEISSLGAVGGTLNDGWKDGVLDLQAYRGQTIKLRVLSDTTGWTVSHARVDSLALYTDAPAWTPSDVRLVHIVDDANNTAGPHLLLDAAFQSATSSAFVVPTAVQSLHFKYITWNDAGSAVPSNVHVDVLNGSTFAEITPLGAVGGTLNDGWKEGVLDLQAYRGQTIKLRVLSDTTGWTISHARVDTLTLARDVPGWTPSDSHAIQLSSQVAPDASGVTAPLNATFSDASAALPSTTYPADANFSAGVTALSSSTYPTNSDFTTGDLAGWTPSNTSLVQVVSDANNIAGPHLLLDAAFQSATSSAFLVPTTTQSLHFKYITWNDAGSTVPSNVHVDVLNGNTFAEISSLGAVDGTLDDGWKDGVLDLQAYRGQTIKLRVLSDITGWTISHARVDSLALYTDAPAWTPSDVRLVHIVDDANNIAGPHLLLDAAFQSATSSAFVVPTAAQSLHFKYITWNDAGSTVPSAVHVQVLNGSTFAEITPLADVGGTLDDGWKDGVLDLQAFQGQTIKLRVLSDTTGWTVSHARVDSFTLWADAPAWTPSDVRLVHIVDDANNIAGPHLLLDASSQSATSSAFVVPDNVQSLHFKYMAWSDEGSTTQSGVHVDVFNGIAFAETTLLGDVLGSLDDGWKDGLLDLQAYHGQTIKLRVRSDSYPWSPRHARIDSLAIQTGGSSLPANGSLTGGSNGAYVELANASTISSAAFQVPTTTEQLQFDYRAWYAADATQSRSLDVVVLSGVDFATMTLIGSVSGSGSQGWQVATLDLRPFRGRTIQLRFRSSHVGWSTGQARIDNVALTMGVGGAPGGRDATPGGSYLHLSNNMAVTSPAFQVTDETRTLRFDYQSWFEGDATQDRPLYVEALRGTSFVTTTLIGILNSSGLKGWRVASIDLVPYQGQTIKLRFRSNDMGWTTGQTNIDNIFGPLRMYGDQLAAAEGASCPCQDANPTVGRPINTRTGALSTETADFAVVSPGIPLVWGRSYLSSQTGAISGTLGVGWQQPFATRLITATMPGGEPGRVIVLSPMGNHWRFQDRGDGHFEAFPGVFSTLAQVNTTYVQTFPSQDKTYFDRTGRAIAQEDAQGRRLNLIYQDDRLVRVEDATDTQRFLALTYDPSNIHIVRVQDAAGRAIRYIYDVQGNLRQGFDVLDRPTSYTYTNHLLTEIENALGQPTEQTTYDAYTPAGKAIHQVLQDGQVLELTYSSTATVVTTTGADGQQQVQTFAYDDTNTVTGIAVNGTTVREATYDDHATPSRQVDGNGNTTSARFTALGQPQRITDALGAVTQVSYDSQQRPTTITDSQGRQSVSVYDSNNNLVRQTSGITTSYPLGFTTIYTYNLRYPGQNWLEEQRTPSGVVTRYDYDSHGQMTAVTVGYGTSLAQTTTYVYDTIGRVTSSTSGYGTALARTDTTSYNADNSIASSTQNYKNGVFDAAHPDEDIVTTYGYDALGRQVWVRDVLGHYDVTHYTAAGRVDWSVRNFQASGWSGGALPATPPAYSAASPDRNVATLYAYDGLGRTTLITQTGLLSGSFNPSTLQFSAAATRVTRTEYDQLSRPITTTLNYRPSQPASADTNVQTVLQYDDVGNLVWQRDALGRWSKSDYDALNRPFKTIANYEDGDPLTGAHDTDLVSITRYDAAGQLERHIDNYVDGTFTATEPITDRVTLPHYDTLGRVTSTTQNAAPGVSGAELNRVSMTAYDPITLRTQGQRDTLGRWVSQQYDLLGRVTNTIQNCTGTLAPQSCGSTTADQNIARQTRYDALGRAYETVDALGVVTHTTYDGLGRATATTRNYVSGAATTAITNVTTLTNYDVLGRAIATTDALGHTSTTGYNSLSQTTVMTDTAGRVTRMGYDGNGTLRWTKRNDGQLTLYQLDGLGRSIATIVNYQDGTVVGSEPVDQDLISRTSYDLAGRRTQITDAAGRVTAFAYDNQDRLIAVTEHAVTGTCTQAPCNIITQYQYDRAGNRTAIIDANGHTRSFSYDAANQSATATDALGQTTAWDYDAGGRVTTQHDPRGSSYNLTYHYSALNQITQTLSLNLPTPIGAQYDVLGRRTQLVDATGTTSFHYNPLGQITQVQAPNTGIVGYGYDASGQRTTLTYPDNTSIQYGYDAGGQLDTVTQGVTALANYDYDTAGRLHTATKANGATTTVTYDSADRLRDLRTTVGGSDVSRFQYSVDRLGQRTNTTETLLTTRTISYTYDGLQRLSGATEAPGTTYSYSYDDAGNRTGVGVNGTRTVTQTFNAANQVDGFTYDAAGNLTSDGTTTSSFDPLNRMTGSGGTTYTYNGDGVLVYDGTTRYTQDLASPLSQILQSTHGSATTKYLYGRDRLASVASSTRTWYGTDALRSVRQTLSDAGTPLSVVNYDPWGTLEDGSVPTFGFTGELQDAATGLVNLRARWYSAGQGRFASRDPFAGDPAVPSSQHPYQYGYSDPVLNTDPSGRCSSTADRERDPCWVIYNQVVIHLPTYTSFPDDAPEGLDAWETPALQHLLGWMLDGIRFTPQGNTEWTVGAMQTVIEGLDRVNHYFDDDRSRTKNALGLNGGALYLDLNQTANGSYMETSGVGHTISLKRQFPEVFNERGVQTFVHELGHIVDFQATRVTGIGENAKWTLDPHGPWGLASGWWNGCMWSLSDWGRQGAVSAYAVGGTDMVYGDMTAKGDAYEDFAETFNWVIQDANNKEFWPSGATGPTDKVNPYHKNASPTNQSLTDPNYERRHAVEDLLARF